MEQKRNGFSGKIGFVLAAAGSAVGLGNIWRFPYLAAEYGGGIFLLVYIVLAITFGFSLMVAEIAIGRKTGLSPIAAYKKLDKRFAFLGYLGAIVPMIILPYYSVIGGWVTKYFTSMIAGSLSSTANDHFFKEYIGKTGEPVIYFLLFIGITALIVLFGVEKGIEKCSKVMMPILVVLSVGIAIYTVFLPGAKEGVIYYLKPDFSKFTIKTVIAAMGQLFYSMSLAMGIMITYGSYMKKNVSIASSTRQISLFDTGIAFFSGLMVIPAYYAFTATPNPEEMRGFGLMFQTLPKVFESMPGGQILAIVFFLLVFFAALTSSISLMETVISTFMDRFGWTRKISCLIVLLGTVLLGLVSSFGFGIWENVTVLGKQFLDFFDFISNSVIMPIVAFGTCVFVGYIIRPSSVIEEAELGGIRFQNKKMFTVMIKYIAPVFILAILVSSVLDAFGVIKI